MASRRQDNDKQSRLYLESKGYVVQKVEFHNFHSGKKRDLFGVFDYLAAKPNQVLACQTTSYGADRTRAFKILASPKAFIWLYAGGEIVVHGWKRIPHINQDGTKSARLKDWSLRETFIDLNWPWPKQTVNEARALITRPEEIAKWLRNLKMITPQKAAAFLQ